MLTRRSISMGVCASVLVRHKPSNAQAAGQIRRIGFLSSFTIPGSRVYDPFKREMQRLGWIEGVNVEYRPALAAGDISRLDTVATEMLREHIDVILVINAQEARSAQRVTKTVPIVMANVSNAVDNGFIASLARPGGNLTGITSQLEEVLANVVALVNEAAPNARRMAIVLNETNPSNVLFWATAQNACNALRVTPIRVAANEPSQLASAVAEIVRQRGEAAVVVADAMYLAQREKLHALTQAAKLPVGYQFREHVKTGGLLSYASNLQENLARSAVFVDKILKGSKPADIPVEQPTRFELSINLATAQAPGLKIAQSMLLRADEVIQ